MRTTLYHFACMLLLMSIAACSQEANNLPVDETDEGAPTLMALTLSFPTQGMTRADEDAGLPAESEIKTVDVLIYGSNHLLLKSYHYTIGDFTASGGSYTATKLIQTTTGLKYVFVAANLPSTALKTLTDDLDSKRLYDHGFVISRALIDGGGTNGFIMCSSTLVGQVLKSYTSTGGQETDPTDPALPEDNKFSVSLVRLASKVTVVETQGLVRTMDTGELLGDLEYAVDHYNLKSFLIQGNAPDYADPNWDEAGWKTDDKDAAVTSIVDSKYWDELAKKPAGSGYKTVNSYGTKASSLNIDYVSENTSQPGILLKGTLTRLIVRATFVPGNVYESDATSKTFPVGYKEVAGPAVATTFYKVTDELGREYFTLNKSDIAGLGVAVGVASSTDKVEYDEYTDGLCYYSLWFNNAAAAGLTRYQTLRNQYYACTIKSVRSVGSPKEELIDPEMPMIEPETNISVEIAVKPWQVVANDYILGE